MTFFLPENKTSAATLLSWWKLWLVSAPTVQYDQLQTVLWRFSNIFSNCTISKCGGINTDKSLASMETDTAISAHSGELIVKDPQVSHLEVRDVFFKKKLFIIFESGFDLQQQ